MSISPGLLLLNTFPFQFSRSFVPIKTFVGLLHQKATCYIMQGGNLIVPAEEKLQEQDGYAYFTAHRVIEAFMAQLKFNPVAWTTTNLELNGLQYQVFSDGVEFEIQTKVDDLPESIGRIYVIEGGYDISDAAPGNSSSYDPFIQELLQLSSQPTDKRTTTKQPEFYYFFSVKNRAIDFEIKITYSSGDIQSLVFPFNLLEKTTFVADVSYQAITNLSLNESAENIQSWQINILSQGIELPSQVYVLDTRHLENERIFAFRNSLGKLDFATIYGQVKTTLSTKPKLTYIKNYQTGEFNRRLMYPDYQETHKASTGYLTHQEQAWLGIRK